MKKLSYLEDLDFKQHFQDWHRFVLPMFVILAAVLLVLFLIVRTTKDTKIEWDESSMARIGLLDAQAMAVFDPAFAIPSPIEMVMAPTADHFTYPVGSHHGALTYNAQPFFTNRHLGDDLNGIGGWNSDLGDPVYAIGDGLVVFAGWPADGWGNVVILQHELADGQLVQSFYAHLDSMHVPVGRIVRRGEQIGTIGNADGVYLAHLHFEIRIPPSLDVGGGYSDSRLGRVAGEMALRKWNGREDDQLVAAPTGTPPEPGSFQMGFEDEEAQPESESR